MLGYSPIASATLASTGSVSVEVVIVGIEATGVLGTAEGRAGADIFINGFEVQGLLFPPDVFPGTGVTINITGFELQALLGSYTVWGDIVPVPTEDWQNITPVDSAVWQNVAASSPATWANIPVTPATNWNDIAPNPATEYTEIKP